MAIGECGDGERGVRMERDREMNIEWAGGGGQWKEHTYRLE